MRSSKITLLDIVMVLTVVGLVVGALLVGRELIDSSKLRAQITQISAFDSSVSTFYEKYDGLPGDLIAAKAEAEGLPHGDGKPAHGDGDGKISPCNLGWQSNLGCENALFWAHLSAVGLIAMDYTSDSGFGDTRINSAQLLDNYLPQSPLSDEIYITVWNTDATLPSPGNAIPYGNYYEISRMYGIGHDKMQDNNYALTPAQARAIDIKLDDGYPLTGRIIANGKAAWPDDAWGSLATPGEAQCVSSKNLYNTQNFLHAHKPLCHLAIAMSCCKHEEER